MKKLTTTILSDVICQRPPNSYKGTFGRAVLIGGNEQFGGAILMSAEAALASGTGLVTVVTAEKNHAALHARSPEAMVVDWSNDELLASVLENATVILIGPGLGLETISHELLAFVLTHQKESQWLVIDGSAITLFAEMNLILKYPKMTVFTPHQMEWQRLSQLLINEQSETANKKKQAEIGGTIVLKSHRTEIYGLTATYSNPIGTPAMATGGMGDTLAGMITGFLAQFENKEAAICAAVYLHSLIGETLGKTHYVVLPTEISKQLPLFMKKYEQ